jgi:hypothetical protein
MAGKGVKKTVGKARKGDVTRSVMKLSYVKKPNGVYAPRYEPVPPEAPETQPEQA